MNVMRILCLITVGSLLVSTALSESDAPTGPHVQRVPRALVLQPVMKVNNAKEDDDSPFDWISSLFSRMMGPSKKLPPTSIVPELLGPIRVPGLDDEVFIKKLQSMDGSNSRVLVRVMPQMKTPMTMAMESSPFYNHQQYQQPQMSYYHQQQVTPTRQLPMQSSGGFVPHTQATLPSWTRPQSQYHQHVLYNQQSYPKNNAPPYNYNYNYNYSPQNPYKNNQYSGYRQPYSSSYQGFSQPYNPSHYSQQNPYGTYDLDNSIPQNKVRTSTYGVDPLRTTNYPLYPPLNDNLEAEPHTDDLQDHTVNKDELNDADHSKAKTTTPEPSKYKEVYRPDRMVPTNPTWKNRFWTRTSRKSVSSTTTPSSLKNNNSEKDNNNNDDDNEKKKSHIKERNKYSSTDIEEISAPDFKNWSGKREESSSGLNSDSRMDEDGIAMKDGTLLGRGESQEHFQGEKESTGVADNTNWQPMESASNAVKIQSKDSSSRTKEAESQSSSSEEKSTVTKNNPPDSLKRILSLDANSSWKHRDLKRPAKHFLRKGAQSSNRRVRIVESVKSSISMTSSKGFRESPSSKMKT